MGSNVRDLKVGDVLYMSRDHSEYCLEAEDRLHTKLPGEIDPKEAVLFGLTSIAMRSCRNADLRMGDRLLIVGAGILGQMATQIAAIMGPGSRCAT